MHLRFSLCGTEWELERGPVSCDLVVGGASSDPSNV